VVERLLITQIGARGKPAFSAPKIDAFHFPALIVVSASGQENTGQENGNSYIYFPVLYFPVRWL